MSLNVTASFTGRAPDAATLAARATRNGWWYYTEFTLLQMRAHGWPVVVAAIGTPLFYLLAMGVGLGRLVDAGSGDVGGVPYLLFVAPAILVSTIVMGVSGELTYPVMTGFRWQRLYYAPTSTPVTPQQVATGGLVAVLIRFAAQAAVFWVLMVAFGATSSPWSALVIPVAVLSAGAFGAPLQAFAASQETDQNFSLIQRFVIMPMSLFAGTYFPLSVMPVWLQWIGWLSPIWHGTELARVAAYGSPVPGWLIGVHVGFLVACMLGGHVVARAIYARKLYG